MCDDEFTRRRMENIRLATELAQRVRDMGAAAATFPIFIEDEQYEVSVKHIPVDLGDGQAEP